MNRRNRKHLVSVVCLALLGAAAGGCAVADTGAFVRLQEDMEVLKAEVAASRRMAASPGATGPDEPASLRRDLADLAAENDRIKADLLAVTTRTDETKLEMQKEVSRLNGTTVEMGQTIQELKGKVTRLEEKVEKGTSSPAAAAPPKASLEELSTPEEMYDYALGLIKNGNTKKGREVLNTFAAKYPDHRLMQNVFYWKGETFYAEKDYESAILSFQDVVDKYAGGEKAPDAMFKQGLSFQALNDNRNARILYELLLSKYPKSPAAERARQRLVELR
jgi:tol-pal system protein YbgF